MKTLLRFATCLALVFGVVVISAQTTYNITTPAACGVYAAKYTCSVQVVTPEGNIAALYAPHNGYPFGYIYFAPGTATLGGFGYATIDSVMTFILSKSDNGKKPNTQGYIGLVNYSETTTFHEQSGVPYTGSSLVNYTTTTQCCSSGRGASEHTTWVMTGGIITIQ